MFPVYEWYKRKLSATVCFVLRTQWHHHVVTSLHARACSFLLFGLWGCFKVNVEKIRKCLKWLEFGVVIKRNTVCFYLNTTYSSYFHCMKWTAMQVSITVGRGPRVGQCSTPIWSHDSDNDFIFFFFYFKTISTEFVDCWVFFNSNLLPKFCSSQNINTIFSISSEWARVKLNLIYEV